MSTSKAEGGVAFPPRGSAYLFERLKDFAVAALAQAKVRPCSKIVILGCLCKRWGVASSETEGGVWKLRNRQARKIKSELCGSKDKPSSFFALFKPALFFFAVAWTCLDLLPQVGTPHPCLVPLHLWEPPLAVEFWSLSRGGHADPRRDTSSHKKACYISSSHVWNNLWVCAADPGETINQPKSKGNGLSYF